MNLFPTFTFRGEYSLHRQELNTYSIDVGLKTLPFLFGQCVGLLKETKEKGSN